VPVHATDIAPTIASIARLPRPQTMDGLDLTNPENLPANRLLHSAWPTTLVRWPYKYIEDDGNGERYLFNLERDPLEQKDLTSLEPEVIDGLRRAWRKEARRLAEKRRALVTEGSETLLIDPESMRVLQSLGYLETQ